MISLYDVHSKTLNYKEAPRDYFINSISLLDFKPPYLSFNLECAGNLRVLNLVFKLSELLECPICIIDADRYAIENYTREHCLTKSDIYWNFIIEKRSKYYLHLLELLKSHIDKEEVYRPTYSRHLLYA